MLEARFNKNFTLMFDSQKGVVPTATLDGRKILISSIDLQWFTDTDRYQGNRNYVKFKFYFEDDLKKASDGDDSLLDEAGKPRQTSVTIRECLYDTDTNKWFFPKNTI